ncbi:MAG: polysaccharide lyase beta-sandwich domain-containing protein [Coprobacillus cateniformis]
MVLPNKTTGEVDTYSKNIPIDILANTKDIQAVRHKDLNITQINFYKGWIFRV